MAEIMAPVGAQEQLLAAVRCGADAVYLGGKGFNARRNAANFDALDLAEAVKYCHQRGVRVYVTVNTVITDSEREELEREADHIAAAGADAVIIQDMATLRLFREKYPTIERYASTQTAVHNVDGAKYLESCGFHSIVLARELSLAEMEKICAATPLKAEAFVHGAHCMSLSGGCYLSAMLGGRSGNRGLCAQPCRLDWHCGGGDHVLSLKDMSLISHLREMTNAGVTTLKIEGRMKRPEYVAAAVTACKNALEGKPYDLKTLEAVFSRSGFTDGYLMVISSFPLLQLVDRVARDDSLFVVNRIHPGEPEEVGFGDLAAVERAHDAADRRRERRDGVPEVHPVGLAELELAPHHREVLQRLAERVLGAQPRLGGVVARGDRELQVARERMLGGGNFGLGLLQRHPRAVDRRGAAEALEERLNRRHAPLQRPHRIGPGKRRRHRHLRHQVRNRRVDRRGRRAQLGARNLHRRRVGAGEGVDLVRAAGRRGKALHDEAERILHARQHVLALDERGVEPERARELGEGGGDGVGRRKRLLLRDREVEPRPEDIQLLHLAGLERSLCLFEMQRKLELVGAGDDEQRVALQEVEVGVNDFLEHGVAGGGEVQLCGNHPLALRRGAGVVAAEVPDQQVERQRGRGRAAVDALRLVEVLGRLRAAEVNPDFSSTRHEPVFPANGSA